MLSNQSQFTLATNISSQYRANTFEGHRLSSLSSDVRVMTTDTSQESTIHRMTPRSDATFPRTFEFPQSSTGIRYSPRPTIPDEHFPPVNYPPSLG